MSVPITPIAGFDPETVARVWWAMVANPGDEVVGQLIGTLGAEASAAEIQSTTSARYIASRTGQLEPEDICWLRRRLRLLSYPREISRVLDSAARSGYRLLIPGSPEWPSLLEALGPASPFVLFCRGDMGVLQAPVSRVALVGTRRASPAGLRAAAHITRVLASQLWVSVSGGARGIDTAVHRASVEEGHPTVVVSATSLEEPYPPENNPLFREVARLGLVVSETPLGKPIGARSFLARNRLIAGLSDATLVVEAPLRSGALNTASHAKTMGRPLYTVSYPHESSSNAGARRLLEEWGAFPVRVGRGIVGDGSSL